MAPFNLKIKNVKIPLPIIDLVALSASFYAGYSSGKGYDIGDVTRFSALVGPSVVASALTAARLSIGNRIALKFCEDMIQNPYISDAPVDFKDGRTPRPYRDLTNSEQDLVSKGLLERVEVCRSNIQSKKYIKPALKDGAIVALETAIGYWLGKGASYIF